MAQKVRVFRTVVYNLRVDVLQHNNILSGEFFTSVPRLSWQMITTLAPVLMRNCQNSFAYHTRFRLNVRSWPMLLFWPPHSTTFASLCQWLLPSSWHSGQQPVKRRFPSVRPEPVLANDHGFFAENGVLFPRTVVVIDQQVASRLAPLRHEIILMHK